jgi:hypothetical protein
MVEEVAVGKVRLWLKSFRAIGCLKTFAGLKW